MSTCVLCNGRLIRQVHPSYPNVVLIGCTKERCPYSISYSRLAMDVAGEVQGVIAEEVKDAPDNHTNEG